MILDLASFAFGCNLVEGTGTPPWGTSLGQHKPDYAFSHDDYPNVIVGMLYNSVPLKQVCLPIGRGGNIVSGLEDTGIQLASVFERVFVNGVQIKHPFTMVIYKETSDSHNGRRHLKYNPKISYRRKDGYVCSNEGFIEEIRKVFGLSNDACWFVYEMDFSAQTELRINAIFVDKQSSVTYPDSRTRKQQWQQLVEQQKQQ